MSVIDIVFRVDQICKKFDKYDVDKQRNLNAYGDDAFACIYASVQADIESAVHVESSFLSVVFLLFALFIPFLF